MWGYFWGYAPKIPPPLPLTTGIPKEPKNFDVFGLFVTWCNFLIVYLRLIRL